jgi:hypothetical protein
MGENRPLAPFFQKFPAKFPAGREFSLRDECDRDWVVSQPPGSLHRDFGYSRKCRPFRGLEGKDPVSRQELWRNRTESRESRGESVLDDFSISENWIRAVQRRVAFPQRPVRTRTGSEAASWNRSSRSVASRRSPIRVIRVGVFSAGAAHEELRISYVAAALPEFWRIASSRR